MVNSGRIEPSAESTQMDALMHSLEAVFEYNASRGYDIQLVMEPCDSAMDARQLIGPWQRTKELVNRLHAEGLPLHLTLDTAHTVEEKQDFLEALYALKAYCNHIHYANCRTADPSDPLWGDKHLSFDIDGGEWGVDRLGTLTKKLFEMYSGQRLRLTLEALCREEDPFRWFDRMLQNMPYLFEKRRDRN